MRDNVDVKTNPLLPGILDTEGEIMYWKFITDLWTSAPSYPNDETDCLLQIAAVIEDGRKK